MRVLSFIPAILLAAAGFVAAVPTAVPASTSCVSNPTGGNGNDAALQPAIVIITNITTYIQPLSDQLASLSGDSCTPDAVSSLVVRISAAVSTGITQLQSIGKVDLAGLDLTDLCATIYGLLTLIFTILKTLVAIVLVLGAEAVGALQDVICNLLHAVIDLVGCLQVFVDASLSGVLGPVITLVCSVAEFLLTIVGKLNVVLGVH